MLWWGTAGCSGVETIPLQSPRGLEDESYDTPEDTGVGCGESIVSGVFVLPGKATALGEEGWDMWLPAQGLGLKSRMKFSHGAPLTARVAAHEQILCQATLSAFICPC